MTCDQSGFKSIVKCHLSNVLSMALVRRKISGKKQAVLTAAVVALFAFTFGLAYFFLLKKPDIDLTPKSELLFGKTNDATAPPPRRSGLDALQELNKSAAANQLKKFGNWPLPVEPKGRADLFGLPAAEKPKK